MHVSKLDSNNNPIQHIHETSTFKSVIERHFSLDSTQFDNLADHKYNVTDDSIVAKLFMTRFWNWVVELYPLWLAPNLITITGLVINIVCAMILIIHTPSATEIAPSWTYALCAFSLFAYQTLDATDGKQARRTGNCTPVGELFDHGCDSVSQGKIALPYMNRITVIVCITLCHTMRLGKYPGLVILLTAGAIIMFYFVHWSTLCTGQMKFGTVDVNEALLSVELLFFCTSVFGAQIWTYKLPIIGVASNIAVISIVSVIGLVHCISHFKSHILVYISSFDSAAIIPAIPLILVTFSHLIVYWLTPNYWNHTTFYCVVLFGSASTKISHMTRTPMNVFDSINASPAVLILNYLIGSHFIDMPLLYLCAVYSAINTILHAYFVTKQACDHLRIHCFTLQAAH